MHVNKNIKYLDKIIKLFTDHELDYLIVGGTAVNLHGHSRISHNLPKNIEYDYDFWYKATQNNFAKLINCLKSLQPKSSEYLDKIVFRPEVAFYRITEEPFKIEMLPYISGFTRHDFNEVKERGLKITLQTTEAFVISYEDLIKTKKATNRDIDKSDIKALEEINSKKKDSGLSM